VEYDQLSELMERRARKRAKRRRAQMRAAQAAVLRVRAVYVNACDNGWKSDEALALQRAFVDAMQIGDEVHAAAIEHLSHLTPAEANAAIDKYEAIVAAQHAAEQQADPVVETAPSAEEIAEPEPKHPVSPEPEPEAQPVATGAAFDDDDDPFTDWVDNPEANAIAETALEPVVESPPVESTTEIETVASPVSEPAPAVEKPRRRRRSRN
jgi:hypothetical protein